MATAFAGLAFLVMVAVTGTRIYSELYPGPRIEGNRDFGFCDFYNGIYYPTKAFLDGESPYDPMVVEDYPVSRQVPFFSPAVFMAHSPFTLFSKDVAACGYFMFLMIMTLAVAWMGIRMAGKYNSSPFWILLLATFMLMTRAGHNSMFNGYFTLQMIIGTILTIHYPRKFPLLAALGLVIVSFKPTFAIPLFLIMIAQGYWKPALMGAAASTVLAVAGLIWITGSVSPTELISIPLEAQSAHNEFTDLWPVNTWTRVDTVTIYGKWFPLETSDSMLLVVMVIMLVLPCLLLRKMVSQNKEKANFDSAAGPIGMIWMLAMLVSIYHHFYDAMILIIPMMGLLFWRFNAWASVGAFHRWFLFALISFPFFNYLSAKSVIRYFDIQGTTFQIITSVNGVCLLVALIYACFLFLPTVLSQREVDSESATPAVATQ